MAPLPETLSLLRHAAGPERLQLAAAHHSEESVAFPGRQDGAVKGMSSRHSGSSAAIRWISDSSEEIRHADDLMTHHGRVSCFNYSDAVSSRASSSLESHRFVGWVPERPRYPLTSSGKPK